MADRKKIAAIVTTWYPHSHADVIVKKFLKGFPTDDGLVAPKVDVVSMYMDQIHENDVGLALAAEHDVPVFRSISGALKLGGSSLVVEGVLIIGEHGDYAWNERDQHLYPRRFFFEQVTGTFATSGRSVPIYTDKHLSWNWNDARWMYDRALALGFPLMAGSSLPLVWRDPWLEYEMETSVQEAVAVAYGGIESYGFHALETLQCMLERRAGGETGIRAVQCLEGDAVWDASKAGSWWNDLADAAAAGIEDRKPEPMAVACDKPVLFLIEYSDGTKGASLLLNDYLQGWGYAGRVDGEAAGCAFVALSGEPHAHFSYLGLNIQKMFLTGEPAYPAERTLLVTGALEALMTSRFRGYVRIETPHLDVAYSSYAEMPVRPTGAKPSGASVVPWEEQ